MDPATTAELSQHASALRALARQLVGDQCADDLVQDASLAALRSPPEQRAGIGGWLAHVLRNLASNHRRTEARRARHERHAPPPSPQDAAARVAEQHELVQKVTAALLALPEPYHATLLLRFFENLTPTAIAQATGAPLATVKSRLQRGITLLRERMDAAAGGKDWRGAIAGAFGLGDVLRPGAAAAAGVVAGGLLMGTGTKLVSAALAAGLAVAAWLVWNPEPGSSGPVAAPQAASAAPAVAAATSPDDVAPRRDESIVREAAPVGPAASARPLATVRGRCVDENGTPLAGVEVKLTSNSRSSEAMDAWTKDHEMPARAEESQTTGGDGTFAFRFWPPPPMQYFLWSKREGRADVSGRVGEVVAGQPRDLGDLRLPAGSRVRGRVVDADGAPVAGAAVKFAVQAQPQGTFHAQGSIDAQTAADGRFTTHVALPAGDYLAGVHDATTTPNRLQIDGTRPFVDVDLVVEKKAARPTIRGAVVDENGAPVAGAAVAVRGYDGSAIAAVPDGAVRTDARGGFSLTGSERSPTKVTLGVQKQGFEDTTATEQVAWGSDDVRLVLRRGLAVEVFAVDAADGTPVERFQVRIVSDANAFQDLDVRARGRHPGGRARVDGVARGDWLVMVEPAGEALALAAFVPVHVADPGPARVTVPLQRAIPQQVRVRTAAGDAVAGTRVELALMRTGVPHADTHARTLESGLWLQRSTALLLDTGITDGEGRATVRGPAGTQLVLFVRGPGHVPSFEPSVRLDAERVLDVTVGAGGTIAGTATPSTAIADLRRLGGLPPSGDVKAARRGMLPGVRLWREEGAGRRYYPDSSVTIADDGTFRIDGVPPGRWQIDATWFEGAGPAIGRQAALATVDVHDGVESRVDLDLAPLRCGDVHGFVLRNGKPAARCTLRFDALGPEAGARFSDFTRAITTDDEGRFHLRIFAGTYSASGLTERAELPAPERVAVVAGQTTTQTFTLPSGTLRISVVDDAGKPVPGTRIDMIRDGERRYWTWLSRTDDVGVTTVELPIASVQFAILPERLQDPAAQQRQLQQAGGGDPFAEQRIDLGRFVPVAGETKEITLRLPAAWRQ